MMIEPGLMQVITFVKTAADLTPQPPLSGVHMTSQTKPPAAKQKENNKTFPLSDANAMKQQKAEAERVPGSRQDESHKMHKPTP